MTRTVNYAVTGTGEFPWDMLRYDQAWPQTSEDAVNLSEHHFTSQRTVHLFGLRPPTVGRWESFGWSVIGARSPDQTYSCGHPYRPGDDGRDDCLRCQEVGT